MSNSPQPVTGGVEDRVAQLTIAHDELNRQRDSLARRVTSMDAKATTLVGAAAIASGVQAATLHNGWVVIALILSAISGVSGVAALFPRMGKELSPAAFRKKLYFASREEALTYLVDHKLLVYAEDERGLGRRSHFVRIGAMALALAIVSTMLYATGLSVAVTFS